MKNIETTHGFIKKRVSIPYLFEIPVFTTEPTDLPCVEFVIDGLDTYYLSGDEKEVSLSDFKTGKTIKGSFEDLKHKSFKELLSMFYPEVVLD